MSHVHEKNETPISRNIVENEAEIKKRLGFGTSFDVGIRTLTILDKHIQIYFVNGLCDIQYIIELLKELMDLDARGRKTETTNVKQAITNHLTHVQVEFANTLEDSVTKMLSGLIFILIEGEDQAIVIDVRSYPGRGPEEPDTERVVRGARDGYTENIILNTALTRRRIRDEGLRNEIMQVGERSKTDICISYIDGIADPKMVQILKKELEAIKIDGLSMADKIVEEIPTDVTSKTPIPTPKKPYRSPSDIAPCTSECPKLVIGTVAPAPAKSINRSYRWKPSSKAPPTTSVLSV